MTPIDSLDSVLQGGLSAATSAHAPAVSGDDLTDASASILQSEVTQIAPHLLGGDAQKFASNDLFSHDSRDPNDTADQQLSQALRSLAERFQAGQAAQAATRDQPVVVAKATAVEQTSGKQLASNGSWVGAASASAQAAAPVTAHAPDPAPQKAPAVTQPADTGTAPDTGTGTGSQTSSGFAGR